MESLKGNAKFFYDEAKKYLKLEVPIAPAKNKEIYIPNWPRLTQDEFLSDKYTSHWQGATGIAIICGEASGIICLDCDVDLTNDADFIAEMNSRLPPLLCGKIGNPLRPPSRFFRYNGEPNKKFRSIKIDLLSTGSQTILPPSNHPKHGKYEWVGKPLHSLDIDELPYLPQGFVAWLESLNNSNIDKTPDFYTSDTFQKETGRCNHGSHNALSSLGMALFKSAVPFDRILLRLLQRDKEINHAADFLYFLCPSRKWKNKTAEDNAKDFIMEFFKRHEAELLARENLASEKTSDTQEKKKNQITLRTLKDLLETPDEATPFIVENLLPSGGTSIVGAKPKVGKTTLLRQMALSIARGTMFLDRRTHQGPVIYFSVEEKADEVKKHFKAMGADGSEPIYIFAERAPKDAIEQLVPILKEIKPALLILDTLFKIIRVKDTNDYAAVSNALEPIQEIARNTGTHIMGVHHAGKGEREGADALLGSTATFAAFDTAIMLGMSGNKRTITTRQRYGTDLETSALLYDKTTRTSALGPEDWKVRADERSDEILAFIRKAGRPVTQPEIKMATGMDLKILAKTLKSMLSREIIKSRGLGVRNDPILYSIGIL